MKVTLNGGWDTLLSKEFSKEYFKDLVANVNLAFSESNVFPPEEYVFSAFNLCPLEKVKVVIIGQDPYHGHGQANGLCFSVSDGIPKPPSLKNIMKEIYEDLGFDIPNSGNLEFWANQGVLMLNATLTVEEGKAGSHQKFGWEKFTNEVITRLSTHKNGLVFLLWGGFAKGKAKFIKGEDHLILQSGHPSPLSANRGYWFGNKHFSQTNTYLLKSDQEPIDWCLID